MKCEKCVVLKDKLRKARNGWFQCERAFLRIQEVRNAMIRRFMFMWLKEQENIVSDEVDREGKVKREYKRWEKSFGTTLDAD